MTKDALRRKYIVTTPDPVSDILREAFACDDEDNDIFNENGFIARFETLNGHERADVLEALNQYEAYHRELVHFERMP